MTVTDLTTLDADTAEALRAGLRGVLIEPGDPGYEHARMVWNGDIDRRPAAIASCEGAADVMHAVKIARDADLVVAVRGGGHSAAGMGTCDGGLVIDLSRMGGVWVDASARVARCQGGALWGTLDHESEAFGLATTGGHVSHTGIGGLTLGGGTGWLCRSLGLACDNLLSVDVVTADGSFVRASGTENDELFWALRGGGGNFGVATSFEFALHPVAPVLAAMTIFPLEHAAQALRAYGEWSASAPRNICCVAMLTDFPPDPLAPPEGQPPAEPGLLIAGCWLGDHEEGEREWARVQGFAPHRLAVTMPVPYTAWQSVNDAGWAHGTKTYWKSAFADRLDDGLIGTILDRFGQRQATTSAIVVHQLGGAVRDLAADTTAYAHRDHEFNVHVLGLADPATGVVDREWARSTWSSIVPHTAGTVSQNFSVDDDGQSHLAFGDAYDRLAAVKRQYDPGNFFRLNHNISPSPASREGGSRG